MTKDWHSELKKLRVFQDDECGSFHEAYERGKAEVMDYLKYLESADQRNQGDRDLPTARGWMRIINAIENHLKGPHDGQK